MLGRGYVVQHCIAFFRKREEEKAFRVYVTDALRAITSNTANMFGGYTIASRYAELVGLIKADERSGDEIVADILERLRAEE